jgi:hypothetical protein
MPVIKGKNFKQAVISVGKDVENWDSQIADGNIK